MRAHLRFVLALLVAAAALAAVSPPARACGPYITGTVECADGSPVPGEPVSIYRQSDGICNAGSYNDTTDGLGEFMTCIFCTGTTTVTIHGEARTLSVNGFTDFGTWTVPCGADADQDGLEDALERQLAEKFSPVLHKHSWDTQPDLADIDQVFSQSRLIIYDWVGTKVHDVPLSTNLLHASDGLYFCTFADDSLYGRMYVNFPDSLRTQGAAPGSRPLYFHAYPDAGYIYIQYWYFLTYNDLTDRTNNSTWHEGDWEHVTVRVANVGGVYQPDLVNFYRHEGGRTRSAVDTWWGATADLTYSGIQQGYDEAHTHLHVWIASDSHASYDRYESVYHFELSNLFGIGNDEYTDNVDYSPDGFDLYFPYDLMLNMGELEYVPSNHDGWGRTFDYHRTHLPVDGDFEWLQFVGRQGDNWFAGFGCPWGSEKPQTPSPYTPATSEIAHQWLEFTIATGTAGFGNPGGDGCFLLSDGGTVSWIPDPPAGDGAGTDGDGDGWSSGSDCDDNDPLVNPGHIEVCSTPYDDNCDGFVNEGCPPGADEYYPRAAAQSHQEIGIDDCMGDSMTCQILRQEDLLPLAPSNDIVMQGGGWTGSCSQMGWRCAKPDMDVYLDDPGLSWPDWCLADGEAYTLVDVTRYDFRGVSVVGCQPLPFGFEYSYRCAANADCYTGYVCQAATGLCVNPCPDADGDGWTTCAGDCNDANANVHPGHAEVCGNSLDDDCDGTVNEGCGGGGGCKVNCQVESPAG